MTVAFAGTGLIATSRLAVVRRLGARWPGGRK